MPAYSLTGGWMALVLVTYSFIADNSSTRFTFYNTNKKIYQHTIIFSSSIIFVLFRDRFIRLQAMGIMWDLSYFVALPLGAFLYNSGGFVGVFGTAVALNVVACILGFVRLRNFKENIKKSDMNIKGKAFNIACVK